MIFITLLRIGNLQKIQLEDGSTVRDVFSFLNAPEEMYPGIYINGVLAGLDNLLKEGDILGLFSPIHGEVTFKRRNQIWRIHKADADDQFPSDFHAHNYNTGETMNIYTGEVYDSRNGVYLRKESKKYMRDFFRRLSQCSEEEIRRQCARKEKFTFLESAKA